jgi:hypothetical protein
MDKLEEHIRKHREEMDTHKPPVRIWNGIEKAAGIRKRNYTFRISAAAMMIVLLGTALLFYHSGATSRKTGHFHASGTAPDNNIQLRETEIYYNNLATVLYKEATPMLVNKPDIDRELSADISHIDSICADIRKDLRDNVDNQDVIEALIRNYRIKIRILEDMLDVLKENEGNAEKKVNNEL